MSRNFNRRLTWKTLRTLFNKFKLEPDVAAALDGFTDTIKGMESSLSSRLTAVEQNLGKKADLDEVQKMNSDTNRWSDMGIKDCIEKAVEARSVEDMAEKNEREKRKTSVIIHGVAESSSTEVKDREDDDIGVIASMLHEIKCDEVQVNSVIRLGRRSLPTNTDEQIKPRPIKMVLGTEEQKVKVLKSAKNLKRAREGAREKIFVHQDLTLKEREERKKLLHEKRTREQNGETDLILVGNKIVKRYWGKRYQEQEQTNASETDENLTV